MSDDLFNLKGEIQKQAQHYRAPDDLRKRVMLIAQPPKTDKASPPWLLLAASLMLGDLVISFSLADDQNNQFAFDETSLDPAGIFTTANLE